MANTINLVTKFQPILDEIYADSAKTIDLESEAVKFDNSKTVKILKVEVPDLADYSRNSGFTTGDVTATWESWTLTQDKGIEFEIDAMDNEETLDQTFAVSSSEFERTKVTPSVDMYRFATMCQTTGISTTTPADLSTGADWEDAITTASATMDNDEVPEEGRILYITPDGYNALKKLFATRFDNKQDNLNRNFEEFDGMKVVKVPSARFVSKIKKDSKGVISKANDGVQVNFMIVAPSAIEAVAKHKKMRVFTPEENQDKDAYKFQYRIYYDIFVYENKVAGVYAHLATT